LESDIFLYETLENKKNLIFLMFTFQVPIEPWKVLTFRLSAPGKCFVCNAKSERKKDFLRLVKHGKQYFIQKFLL